MPVTIRLEELNRLRDAFAWLDGDLPRVMQLIAKGVGYEIKSVLQRYPARKSIPLSAVGGFASDKQRKWFFANMREGNIEVPYRRTDRLKNAWHVERHGKSGALVGNPVNYGPLVQSSEHQTQMMEMIGWTTDEEAVEEVKDSGVIERIAGQVVQRALRALGLA